jgi:hypothetical protein
MKKLKLDELHVESFSTSAGPAARGTVLGHSTETCQSVLFGTCWTNCDTLCGGGCGYSAEHTGCHCTVPPQPTLEGESCNWTCDFRQCATGQEVTCDIGATQCCGATDGLGMC